MEILGIFSVNRKSKRKSWLVPHARYYWLLPAEGHLTRRVLGLVVRRIAALPVPTG
jgi:hypothetical protein